MKYITTFGAFGLSVVCFTLFPSCVCLPLTTFEENAIIFDAGSSKTKIEIYKFIIDDTVLHVNEVTLMDVTPEKVNPGIATLADNPAQVQSYMTPLLDAAKNAIPLDKQASTPIILLATAGMRLLSQDKKDAILAEVRALFNDKTKCPFLFSDPNNARVITGKWEAIYSWITVNFLKEVFVPNSSHKTYGVLDLGGASHQNAMETNKNRPDEVFVNISGTKYSLLVRSYLRYGLDEARARYLLFLNNRTHCQMKFPCLVKSPCHHRGYRENITIDNALIPVLGAPNVRKCRSLIRKIFFCQKPNSLECPFRDQHQLNGTFYGFSGLFYVLRGIGAVCDDCNDNLVNTKMVKRHSRSFCLKNYSEVSSDPYAHTNCFGGNYIYELFKHGYRLSGDQKVTVTNKLNGFDLGWTLGALLHNLHLL